MPTDCLSVLNTTRSLLSVPRSELIANLRDSHRSDVDFGEIISVDIDGTGSVSFGESHSVPLEFVIILGKGYGFSDDNVISRDSQAEGEYAFVVKFVEIAQLGARFRSRARAGALGLKSMLKLKKNWMFV